MSRAAPPTSTRARPSSFTATAGTYRVALYARAEAHEPPTLLPPQVQALRAYAERRGWQVVRVLQEHGPCNTERSLRSALLRGAPGEPPSLDAVLVWRLDRWSPSLLDLLTTLQELTAAGVGFLSLTEPLDLTTAAGRAVARLFSVLTGFERGVLRARVHTGLAHARQQGVPLGRPPRAALRAPEVRQLHAQGFSPAAIAKKLGIGRTSVRRILASRA